MPTVATVRCMLFAEETVFSELRFRLFEENWRCASVNDQFSFVPIQALRHWAYR